MTAKRKACLLIISLALASIAVFYLFELLSPPPSEKTSALYPVNIVAFSVFAIAAAALPWVYKAIGRFKDLQLYLPLAQIAVHVFPVAYICIMVAAHPLPERGSPQVFAKGVVILAMFLAWLIVVSAVLAASVVACISSRLTGWGILVGCEIIFGVVMFIVGICMIM
jgi:hypothetical protein